MFWNSVIILRNCNWIKLKIRNGEVVGNLFSEKTIRDLLESHNFLKFGKKR